MLAKQKAFTLVELMIVIAIIGVISMFAYPSYTRYVERSKRTEAMGVLTNAVQAIEKYRANNYTYKVAGDDITLIFSNRVPVDVGKDKYYDIALVSTANSYTFTATPTGSMAGDGNLTINNTGARTWGAKSCWPEGTNDC
ncbi:type IV pilin protein [Aliikangiella maris]|uniref:Type IV pilin protein n=2 Tax=Aliikangiella maris TaxID=3162458 RepID=A0ABV2BNL1_9GAMM